MCRVYRGAMVVLKGSRGYRTDRRSVPATQISENVCMLLNIQSDVCVPSVVNLYPYQPERRKVSQLSQSVLLESCCR